MCGLQKPKPKPAWAVKSEINCRTSKGLRSDTHKQGPGQGLENVAGPVVPEDSLQTRAFSLHPQQSQQSTPGPGHPPVPTLTLPCCSLEQLPALVLQQAALLWGTRGLRWSWSGK